MTGSSPGSCATTVLCAPRAPRCAKDRGTEPLEQLHRSAERPVRLAAQVLGPNAEAHRSAQPPAVAGLRCASDKGARLKAQGRARRIHRLHHGGHEVDGGSADGARHGQGGGAGVELQRRAHLFDPPRVHHHDAIGQRHGFGLVVGDVDHGDAQRLVQPGELVAQARAQVGVQVGEGLVQRGAPWASG